jgi:two-component system sensor histidine kinase VicK
MEAGHIDLNKKPLVLAVLLRDSMFQYSVQAGKHNINLTLAIEADLPVITADARRLNRVLDNLLNNALKFTRDGGRIEVGARRENSHQVTVWVKDDGVGIAADELPHVFEKYRQVSSSKQSPALGTGLGLAICKKLVEAHDGVLWVESKENSGTTFFFSLPAGLPQADDLIDHQLAAF